MANIKTINKATTIIIEGVDNAIADKENKDNPTDRDSELIDALQEFRDVLEEALDNLNSAYDNA